MYIAQYQLHCITNCCKLVAASSRKACHNVIAPFHSIL